MPRLINLHRLNEEPLGVVGSRLQSFLGESQAEGSLDLVGLCEHGVLLKDLLVSLVTLLILFK